MRLKIIPDASKENLLPFIKENVEYGSSVITDGWSSYASLSKNKEYKHIEKVISGSGKQARRIIAPCTYGNSLVKRWINGTHQRKNIPKHLEYYLDEFTFRFNRQLSTHRGKLVQIDATSF